MTRWELIETVGGCSRAGPVLSSFLKNPQVTAGTEGRAGQEKFVLKSSYR